MSEVSGVIAWTISSILLLLTVACQAPRSKWQRSVKYRDVAALIPSWTFFAPNPGTTDTRLLWRELRIDGTAGMWHEILPPVGGLRRALWNPQKRQSKLIADAGPMVLRQASKDPDNVLTLVSVPYLLILHRIISEPGSVMTVARQFTVVQTTTDGEFAPLLLSRWHAMTGGFLPDPDDLQPAQAADGP